MEMKLEHITEFLKTRGWVQDSDYGSNFDRFFPPKELELSQDYFLELPKDGSKPGFQRYAKGVVEITAEIYEGVLTVEDIERVFSKPESIFSFRIADFDTANGTIKLERFKQSIDGLYRVIKQAVIFVATQQPIFGNAKTEVANYINACRSLQTARGSFVTKLELPFFDLNLFNKGSVPDKLIDVIKFVNENALNTNLNLINEGYIIENKEFINIELLIAIKNLYKNTEIRDAEFSLLTTTKHRKIISNNVNQKVDHLDKYIRIVKDILLEEIPLEIIGSIFRLISRDPQQSGIIWIETEIADEKQIVEVRLKSEQYLKAVEAHKLEREIQIKGIAKQKRDRYFIEEVDLFVVR